MRGPGTTSRGMQCRAVFRCLAAGILAAVLVSGCGSGSHTPAATGASHALFAQFLAYSRCMRSHGVSNFPDPTTSGGIGIVLPHSMNLNTPSYKAADQACKPLAPAAHPARGTVSAQKLAAEVRAARCMRSHGDPGFPDPNSQGAFDRSTFTKHSPAFRAASTDCKSQIEAVGTLPGR